MKMRTWACLLSASFLAAIAVCAAGLIEPQGKNIEERFAPPRGYRRVACEKGGFAEYLRGYRLKPHGAEVKLFDGSTKANMVWEAVLDMPILQRDLIQCADAVIKLRAEYFFSRGEYDRIEFTLTNGMKVPFSRFTEGWNVKVKGNRTEWVRWGKAGTSRDVFDDYLRFIYTYCGTKSLAKEMVDVPVGDMRIGDVFIEGGSPGHAVLVMDLAESGKGEKVMILAQSFMPSQEMHVLKGDEGISPWYRVGDGELKTPEWKFKKGSLKRFREKEKHGG